MKVFKITFAIIIFLCVIIGISFITKVLYFTDHEKFIFKPIIIHKNKSTIYDEKLVKAARSGDKETIIKLLSSNKVNVDARNEFGTTALMAASQDGNADLVKLLIEEYNADVNVENFYGRTALMLADYESIETMELLLSNGADANVRNKSTNSTTLMLVAGAHDNYPEVVKLLISYDADITAKDKEGKTAIDYAKDRINNPFLGSSDKAEIIELLQGEASKIKN